MHWLRGCWRDYCDAWFLSMLRREEIRILKIRNFINGSRTNWSISYDLSYVRTRTWSLQRRCELQWLRCIRFRSEENWLFIRLRCCKHAHWGHLLHDETRVMIIIVVVVCCCCWFDWIVVTLLLSCCLVGCSREFFLDGFRVRLSNGMRGEIATDKVIWLEIRVCLHAVFLILIDLFLQESNRIVLFFRVFYRFYTIFPWTLHIPSQNFILVIHDSHRFLERYHVVFHRFSLCLHFFLVAV